MKNITAQYRDLLEGKMSKANFMTNVKMQFPDWISPVNNFEDAVNILKSKRILSENTGDDDEFADMEKKHDIEQGAQDAIASQYDLEETDDTELEAAKEQARKESENGYVQHVNKGHYGYTVSDWYDADSTVASYENGEQINEVRKDIEALQAGALRETLNEAEEKSEGKWKEVTGKKEYSIFDEIDRVNPYEFKRGMEMEMNMRFKAIPNYFTNEFNPDMLAKAARKVLKNLEKDPAYYTNEVSLEIERKINMLQKPKEEKVGADGHMKVKGQSNPKSNVQDNLGNKEKAKGKPKGVKEMKPTKNVAGYASKKVNQKLPKGVEMMKEDFGKLGGVNLGGSFEKMKTQMQPEEPVQKVTWKTPSYANWREEGIDKQMWDTQLTHDEKVEALKKNRFLGKKTEDQYNMIANLSWDQLVRAKPDDLMKLGIAPYASLIQGFAFPRKEDTIARIKEYLTKTLKKELAVFTNPDTGESVSTTSSAGTALAKKMGYSKEEPGGEDIQHVGKK